MLEDKNPGDDAVGAGESIEIEFRDDDDVPDEPAAREDSGAENAAGGEESPEEEATRLRDELEHLREMYLRKLAEFDNYRKRTEREREELRRIAAENLVRELLPVWDNFERALQHAGNGDPEAFREGVEMIARQMWDLLQREGLEAVDPKGMAFDPELHEAVHRIENSDRAPGTVVSVFSKGYVYGGRLLRPAMVGVAVEATDTAGASTPPPGGQADGGGNS